MSFGVKAQERVINSGKFTTSATEFYFVRHGQTDQNAGGITKMMFRDAPLNAVGQQQVVALRSFIETLPIKKICCGPLLRTRQTTNAINKNLKLPVVTISDFREGSYRNWLEIRSVKNKQNVKISTSLRYFLGRVCKGLTQALQQQTPGPVLIVAHSGVYRALCRILDVNLDSLVIGNCTVVHFYKNNQGSWAAEHIFEVGKV